MINVPRITVSDLQLQKFIDAVYSNFRELARPAAAAAAAAATDMTPAGVMLDYGGSVAPSGYLLCYGQEVSRAGYAALFAVIGTSYGAGDGSTTFNVPDMRGRASFGKDDMGGAAASRLTSAGSSINGAVLGSSGGAQNVTLTESQMPAHVHTINHQHASHTTSNENADHNHVMTHGHGSGTVSADHAHITYFASYQVTRAGSYTNIIDNAAANTYSKNPGTGGILTNHSHTITSFTGNTGTQTAYHGHTFQPPAWNGDSGTKGGGDAHTNMPPAVVFNKIIKT